MASQAPRPRCRAVLALLLAFASYCPAAAAVTSTADDITSTSTANPSDYKPETSAPISADRLLVITAMSDNQTATATWSETTVTLLSLLNEVRRT